MRTAHKNKSRTRLYNVMTGALEQTGPAGRSATGSVQFANTATVGETVTIGDFWFSFAAAGESAGTSAGTEADPHVVAYGANVLATATNLGNAMLAETETTGAWGYLHPDDSVAIVIDTDKTTITFWPGTQGNAVTLVGSAGDETLVQPVTASLGRAAKEISVDHKYTVLDTTGSTQNDEYYSLEDGVSVGDTVEVLLKTAAASDTPTILGHLVDVATANVMGAFNSASGGSATFVWTGAGWLLTREGPDTTITFTASS